MNGDLKELGGSQNSTTQSNKALDGMLEDDKEGAKRTNGTQVTLKASHVVPTRLFDLFCHVTLILDLLYNRNLNPEIISR